VTDAPAGAADLFAVGESASRRPTSERRRHKGHDHHAMLSERTPTRLVRRPHDYPQPPRRGASPCHIVRFVHGQGVAIRRTIALAAGTAVLLAACSDPEPSPLPTATDAAPTETASAGAPTPTPTPTAAAIDITTTPDVVTPEWVDAVVNHLLTEYGTMTAALLAVPPIDDAAALSPVFADMRSLFGGQFLEQRAVSIGLVAVDKEGRRSEVLPATDYLGIRFMPDIVQFVEPNCLIAVGRFDDTGSELDGGIGATLAAVSLRRAPAAVDISLNPTPWVILDATLNTDADGKANPDDVMLSATLDTYVAGLDNDCGRS
jgi:hypothetical protein